MTESALDAQVRRVVGRKLVRNPLTWSSLLLVAALIWTLAGDDLGFFPFLLMLVGGWCLGFAFVNATMRMVPARNGVFLHAAVAIVLGAAIAFVVEFGKELLAPLPDAVRGAAVVVQLAAIPAAGWIWLGLLSRITDVITQRDAKKRPAPVTPEWQREESGDGSGVRFPAIPLRMSALTGAIVTIVVVFGLGTTALVIALDDVVLRLGARLTIILIGVVIALPAYFVFTKVLRRRSASCLVAFGNDELRVTVGESIHVIPFARLEHLVWRTGSDYARIEARGDGADLSLVAGLAKPPRGLTAELPPLPRRVLHRLELAGMNLEASRRRDVTIFTRRSDRG